MGAHAAETSRALREFIKQAWLREFERAMYGGYPRPTPGTLTIDEVWAQHRHRSYPVVDLDFVGQ